MSQYINVAIKVNNKIRKLSIVLLLFYDFSLFTFLFISTFLFNIWMMLNMFWLLFWFKKGIY